MILQTTSSSCPQGTLIWSCTPWGVKLLASEEAAGKAPNPDLILASSAKAHVTVKAAKRMIG
ncbi:hypothetical protein [Azospirillum brasilense]|uniref:hypothetical protein n=1 Tax=Azospirillum brasilense TaxID=192 RepID=UPI0010C0A4C4|nr:hypothetical protein [Azospirillum brasilense]